MARRLTLKNYDQETQLFTKRLLATALLVGLLAAGLIARLYYLQIIQHGKYTTLSIRNQMALIPIEPNRGLIYDRNGVLLAENVPSFSLDIIPARVQNLSETLNALQKEFSLDDDTIKLFNKHRLQHRAFEPVPLKMKLTEKELARFYVNQYRYPGVIINARMLRHYPDGKYFATALGYVGRINEREMNQVDHVNYSASNYIGKMGVERSYEDELHGVVGYRQAEVNATGEIARIVKQYDPTPGDNIYLTIDSKLQKAAHDALGSLRGAVVAIKNDTGEVLALVSHPSYDPNLFVNGVSVKKFQSLQNSPNKPLYNRALRGQYPPASTIKPFISLGGLQEDVITPRTYVHDPGWFNIPNNQHIYRDWKYGGHGQVNLKNAITVSCDTYFYHLALNLGINKIDDILGKFGFGEKTNVGLSEELPGCLPSPDWKMRNQHEHWYIGDTIISGIGQGYMLSTPLQLASYTATLANRGKRFRPYVLLKTAHPDGQIEETTPVEEPPVILDKPDYWETVINAMQQVIVSEHPKGTGFRFGRNPPYSVAAKTGTAQITRPKKYDTMREEDIPKHFRSHSLFIAFAPIDDPKIAIAIVVENDKLAPMVARKVMDAYLVSESNTT